MKTQRRHELKQNALAMMLWGIPEIWRKYGTRIMLGLILLALVAVWIRYRINQGQEKMAIAQQSLSEAEQSLGRLERLLVAGPGEEAAVAQQRQLWYSDGIRLADDALDKSGDQQQQLKAQAMLCKGDLNFEMANLPDLRGAATQPSLRPEPSKSELLSNAEDAYQRVTQDYPQQAFEVMAAHFGLAAVAEDRAAEGGGTDSSQWDRARQEYEVVIDDAATPRPFKELAANRLKLLGLIQQPALTNVPPATQNSVPTSMPNTRPTTR
ncbi:MAG: hypothetical protein ABR964_01995 [Tepidisphaeraceae bacterium]|jgi:hypothetical protein